MALAYTGGPIRIELAGYDATENKIYYRQQQYGEASNPLQTFYYRLGEAEQLEPVHAKSLDVSEDSVDTSAAAKRWQSIQKRLAPLLALRDARMSIRVDADSTGTEAKWGVMRLAMQVVLEGNGMRQVLDLRGYCRPEASLRGLYSVPGRPEVVAVLTYVGLAYGCEDVDRVVVFSPGPRQ